MTGSKRLAISHLHLVHDEIVSVTSAMRKNARWSSTSAYAYARNSARLNGAGGMMLARSNAGSSSTLASAVAGATHTPERPGSSMSSSSLRREPPREAELMAGFDALKREIAHADGESLDSLDLPL